MVLAPAHRPTGLHPPHFSFARAIGIYHIHISRVGDDVLRHVDFLHVRWFIDCEDDASYLQSMRFVNDEDEISPYGFVHPSTVVRAVHLIPDFKRGLAGTDNPISTSSLAHRDVEDEDYVGYYVNK